MLFLSMTACAAFANNNPSGAVAENLNILDHSAYLNLVNKLIAHEIPAALIQCSGIVQKGFDGEQFITGLAVIYAIFICVKITKPSRY